MWEGGTLEELEQLDYVSVVLVPERKGLILKHCEYSVSSRRFGTTVNRRYSDFVALHDVLLAKYPYRAVPRLPPKRVVVGGGSACFLSARRAALQRWAALVGAHPVLAHDADTRAFLTEPAPRLPAPRHDEFQLATSAADPHHASEEASTEELQAQFAAEQEHLRLVQLALTRITQLLDRGAERCMEERAGVREAAAALGALASAQAHARPRPRAPSIHAHHVLANCAAPALAQCVSASWEECRDRAEEESARVARALEAVGAYRELCARLRRGLHAERAAAAPQAPRLLARHRYALSAALQEGALARLYAGSALSAIPELLGAHGLALSRAAQLWRSLHDTLARPAS